MQRKYFIIAVLIVAATLAAGLAWYPSLPARVPVHWNIHNQPDRYDSSLRAVLLLPGLMTGIVLVFAALPWLSPRRFEINGSRPGYVQIMLIILAAMAYFHLVMLWASSGRPVDMGRAIMAGICIMFAAMGSRLGTLPRNFYVGIRTPWTIASPEVWDAAHRFGAWTFVIGGLIALALVLAGAAMAFYVTALLAAALLPVVYSLVYYKRLERRGQI